MIQPRIVDTHQQSTNTYSFVDSLYHLKYLTFDVNVNRRQQKIGVKLEYYQVLYPNFPRMNFNFDF